MKNIRVSSISIITPAKGFEENVSEAVKLIREALVDEPDLIVLPEAFAYRGIPIKERIKYAEEGTGYVLDTMINISSKYGTSILVPVLEKENGRIYNSAILVENGKVIGRYRKMFPTISELEAGISPGTEPSVIKTRFGFIGVAICFDINFDELFEYYRDRVKLILFPSAFPGGLLLSCRAIQTKSYIVSAVLDEFGVFVDPLGRILYRSSRYSPVITLELNLDYEVLHIDYNYLKLKKVKEKYGSGVNIIVSRPEAVLILESRLRDKSAKDIMEEFGLEDRDRYLERSKNFRSGILDG